MIHFDPFITFEVPFVFPLKRSRWTPKPYPHEYDPASNRKYKKLIAAAYRDKCKELGICEKVPKPNEVFIYLTIYSPLPKSRPKRIDLEPYTVKPDGDNVSKGVLDALNGIAWDDDAQITVLYARKAPRTRETKEKTIIEIASPYRWVAERGISVSNTGIL